jgi:hypothetical protein
VRIAQIRGDAKRADGRITGEDAKEGMAAYVKKRAARFKGK